MGPIGMLCVQRTLSKGRWSGFISGLGASFSDLIYAALTGFFMGIVVNFIEAHQRTLQIFGSIVMAVFGYYIFRNNPVKSLQRNPELKQSLLQDMATAFFLTFSNVFIVFLYIGLYARFGFVLPEHSVWMTLAGLLGVFAGAILWWIFIAFFVSFLRRWVNIRELKLMNRIVGSIIFAVALIGLVSSFCFIQF